MRDAVHDRLQRIIDGEVQKKHTHDVLLGMQSRDGQVDFAGAAGGATPDSPYFIASVTKMYTSAIIMQLVDEGSLDLDAPMATYLPSDLSDGIHVYQGVDYSHQITIAQLVHQTSGLADYFEGKPRHGPSVMHDLMQGRDREFALTDIVAMVRAMTPTFAPGANAGKKSHYSDTNFQLLGAIIESITGQSIADNFRARIFDRLGLAQTYLYDHQAPRTGQQPLPFYHQDQAIRVPKAMSSVGPDGGIVSTLGESLRFLRAYFDGELFDSGHFGRMMARWNTVFFPVQYGYGLMRIRLPRLMTLFRYSPELIGHSGTNGAFAFYAPKEMLFLAGTVNQLGNPGRPVRLMLRAIAAVT
jgi:D-alanyl-D-alanine carboxypeptidase